MMGLVFTSFVEMIEREHSPELADELLTAARLPHGGAYTAVGYYDFSELETLVNLLTSRTQMSAAALLRHFGRVLFTDILRMHAQVMLGTDRFFELLEGLDRHIHREVLKLYPQAQLPRFDVLESSPRHIHLLYRSPRHLEALAAGLIDGAAECFGIVVEVTLTPTDDGVIIAVEALS